MQYHHATIIPHPPSPPTPTAVDCGDKRVGDNSLYIVGEKSILRILKV
jgi:hypothetical protein